MRVARRLRYFLFILISIFVLTATASAWAAKGGNKGKPGEGSGSDSGDDIKLSCLFDEPGDENITDDDRYPPTYDDGALNVSCSTGGTSQPNLSGIVMGTKAGGGDIQRQLDLALSLCDVLDDHSECMTETERDALVDTLPDSMDRIFLTGNGGEEFGMENVRFNVRPYREQDLSDGEDHGGDHLQNLPPGTYSMAARFALIGVEKNSPRVVLNLAGHHVEGDKFQGVLCDLGEDTPVALTDDVNVEVYDSDSHPTLYAVSTRDDGGDYGYQLASICSNMPVGVCGKGARASDLCTFHGFVKVKFSFMAFELQ